MIKIIKLSILESLIVTSMFSIANAFEIPEPRAVTDCYGTIEAWKSDKSLRDFMATHSCYCPSPTSHPVCTPVSGSQTYTPSAPSSRGLSPKQQMQIQMSQGMMAPIFGDLGAMIKQSIRRCSYEGI